MLTQTSSSTFVSGRQHATRGTWPAGDSNVNKYERNGDAVVNFIIETSSYQQATKND